MESAAAGNSIRAGLAADDTHMPPDITGPLLSLAFFAICAMAADILVRETHHNR
jgi:hypothetical protein